MSADQILIQEIKKLELLAKSEKINKKEDEGYSKNKNIKNSSSLDLMKKQFQNNKSNKQNNENSEQNSQINQKIKKINQKNVSNINQENVQQNIEKVNQEANQEVNQEVSQNNKIIEKEKKQEVKEKKEEVKEKSYEKLFEDLEEEQEDEEENEEESELENEEFKEPENKEEEEKKIENPKSTKRLEKTNYWEKYKTKENEIKILDCFPSNDKNETKIKKLEEQSDIINVKIHDIEKTLWENQVKYLSQKKILEQELDKSRIQFYTIEIDILKLRGSKK